MKFKTLTLSTSFVAAFINFSNVSYATNTAPTLPDEMIVEIFSHLNPKETANSATVSKQFNRAACDTKSTLSQVKNSPEGKTLYQFYCVNRPAPDHQTLLSYARRVLAIKNNPLPNIISTHEFEAAKDIAKVIVDENTSTGTPSYIN